MLAPTHKVFSLEIQKLGENSAETQTVKFAKTRRKLSGNSKLGKNSAKTRKLGKNSGGTQTIFKIHSKQQGKALWSSWPGQELC